MYTLYIYNSFKDNRNKKNPYTSFCWVTLNKIQSSDPFIMFKIVIKDFDNYVT